jgi:hypothetical protein
MAATAHSEQVASWILRWGQSLSLEIPIHPNEESSENPSRSWRENYDHKGLGLDGPRPGFQEPDYLEPVSPKGTPSTRPSSSRPRQSATQIRC